MNDEKLIECVKKHNVLYDSFHSKYTDINYKNNIWRKIGEEMKIKDQQCKMRWSNIRDTFRKYLKKKVIKRGRRDKITKRYKHADQLSFLKKHLNERETLTNIKKLNKNQKGSEEIVSADEQNDSGDEREDVAAASQEAQVDRNDPLQETNRQREDWSAPIQSTKKLPAQPNAVDAFLTGITPTLKSLSPLNFHFAKSEIFSIVQKYELKSLEEQNVQELKYNYDQQQSQFIRGSSEATSSTALLKASPVSISEYCYYSSTSNTPIESPDYTQVQSPSPSEVTMDDNKLF